MKGEYDFLSNFYPCKIVYRGIEYSCSENFYQAMKTMDLQLREQMSKLNPSQSKKMGNSLKLRENWEQIKIDVMRLVVNKKFEQNSYLMHKLKQVKGEIVEDNFWHDRFWGRCNGVGENWLGKILMEIRDEENQDET